MAAGRQIYSCALPSMIFTSRSDDNVAFIEIDSKLVVNLCYHPRTSMLVCSAHHRREKIDRMSQASSSQARVLCRTVLGDAPSTHADAVV